MSRREDWFLEIVIGRRRGPAASAVRGMLWICSRLYRIIIAARNLYYDRFPGAQRRAARTVISVGNLTVGGTGKTPTAAAIAALIEMRGCRPGLLLRGYKGTAIAFDDETRDRAVDQWRMASDEAMVLRRRCPKAAVVIHPDRVAGAEQAIELGAEALVLDDGFQHRRLARDLDIVLIDATAPFGHGHVLPRGLLREPKRALRRADILVLSRSDMIPDTQRRLLIERLQRISAGKPVVLARHRIDGFLDLKGRPVTLEDHGAVQAVIFAGVANFEGFRHSVETLGVKVLATYQYPDHHAYTDEEIAGLADTATTLEANAILTSEKDAVKLVGRWPEQGCPLLVLNLVIEFDKAGGKILGDALDRVL